ncbi:MAG: DUF2797 domain-containing protein [Pontibacterium sp.]
MIASGALSKMRAHWDENNPQDPVSYHLPLDDQLIHLNPLIGGHIELTYQTKIFCTHCGRKTNKSFSQGYCYPCFKKLPQCDRCIVSPELCHYQAGTCRDSQWGEKNCFAHHYVYLSNTSGVKVGITRGTQLPTRWLDQGAVQALPILRVETRFQSGLVERLFANHVADKTNWRAMLKGQVEPLVLSEERDRLFALISDEFAKLEAEVGISALQKLEDAQQAEINYPVLQYPTKVATHNFDKAEQVAGRLLGIKGQYLILDTGVINIRKFTGYQITLAA